MTMFGSNLMMQPGSLFDQEIEYRPLSAAEELFTEEPVPLDVFIQDKAYLGQDWMLSPRQAELVRIIERVYLKETFYGMAEWFGGYWAEPYPMKNLITAQWGKGGGKDSTVRVAAMRVAYLLICLKSPQRYFGMPEDDSIHILNIAANAPQAHRAFFEPLTRMVKRGWFADKAEPKRDTIEYAKNITAISGHSDAESQEGLNIILGIADEIDAFKAKGEMVGQGNRAREASTSAESILNMIKTSASTRFPENYKRVAISYPRYQGSTIQKLTLEAIGDIEEVGDENSIYYASGPFSTWEVNPRISGPEAYASDYRKDPDEAAAKYECKPTRATDAYFRNPAIFRQAVDRPEQPISVDYRVQEHFSKVTGNTVRGWEPVFTISPDFMPVPGARYAMHGDLALVGDRAGIAMSHVEAWEERTAIQSDPDGFESEYVTTVPIIRNDFTISFGADVGALDPETGEKLPREIQIRWARMLAFELIKRGFWIASFTFDGFQSAETIQVLSMHGIESDRVSTDRDPSIWKTLKDTASEGRLRMPFNLRLQNELEALSRVKDKVDHPIGGSKDEADAFACSIVGAIAAGGAEDPDGEAIESGGESFMVGVELEPLAFGQGSLALPFGMKGMGLNG